jgi:hypothetical protein
MVRYDPHLDVWIERHEILSESHTSIDLIGFHRRAKSSAKGPLQGSHGHAEFGRDPRHSKLRVSVIERNHMMCETCGIIELFGDFACSNLAPNFSNQHERLLFCARKDARITPRHDRSMKQNQIFSDRERTSLGHALKRVCLVLTWRSRRRDDDALRGQSPFQDWAVSRDITTSHLGLCHKRHVQASLLKTPGSLASKDYRLTAFFANGISASKMLSKRSS